MADENAAAWYGKTDAELLELLSGLWACWRQQGQQIGPEMWDKPSQIGQWTVKDLYGHLARGFGVLEKMLSGARDDDSAEADFPGAADYFRNFRSWLAESSARSAHDAAEYAQQHSTAELIQEFARARDVIGELSAKIGQQLPTPFGTTTARAYLVTRIVEATVHLADLQRAIGMSADVPDEAAEVTALLLLELSPRQAFIDAATGRGIPDFFPVLV